MLAQNVVKLENTQVYDQIEKFLTKHKYNSTGTADEYRRDIEMFFRKMKDKEIKYLTREDVQLSLDDFEDFIEYLYNIKDEEGNKNYVNKTINRKISAVKGLIKYLAAKKIVDDISYLELIDSLPEVGGHHGTLETSEVFKIAEWVRNERQKGEIKRLMILFSFDTCARKNEVLSLKWSNFIEKEDGVLVSGIGKGNKEFRQMISKDFYNELLTLKSDKEKVFDISTRRIDDMMVRIREHFKIPKERNIVFHSFRKAGATFRYRITGDILEAKRSLNHSNINTTQLYLAEEDYGTLGAVSSAGNMDIELYKKVDHDVLLDAISKCKKDLQLILNLKINEILNNK